MAISRMPRRAEAALSRKLAVHTGMYALYQFVTIEVFDFSSCSFTVSYRKSLAFWEQVRSAFVNGSDLPFDCLSGRRGLALPVRPILVVVQESRIWGDTSPF